MTNSFFQTKVNPDDMHLLTVCTPWGTYEWTVMPMGVHNALVFHQCCMVTTLRHLIGKIYHVYQQHQNTFRALKALIISPACLTVINHDKPGENLIFLTCNASDYPTGAVLSWGPTWETAYSVTFESYQLCNAQLNYPVHKKELLAVIKALEKWHIELLGALVHVYTDHCTLEFFNT
jgi:hypothetical protein